MKNCLILGSGRSGTSMLGGVLHEAGYYMGEGLYPGHPSNPKGFFESGDINDLNEMILAPHNKHVLPALVYKFLHLTRPNPLSRQQWLSSIPPNISVSYCSAEIQKKIKIMLSKTPYCYKDPRFSYTLPVWQRFIDDETQFICIFRAPDITINSILKECSNRTYLRNLYITRKYALKMWINIYSHILIHNNDNMNTILFVHYNQILDGSALNKLSDLLEVRLSGNFPDPNLKRTVADNSSHPGCLRIYKQLCALAGYKIDIQ